MPTIQGKITIAGAGPGDPELLTVKALKAAQQAKTVVYDRLVSDAIIKLIPANAERIFVGKSCKQKIITQEEINNLLIKLAKEGKNVLRLKGGDPFLFGRGGEEAIALKNANIPFEIIPGISSAQGCSTYAGIPLTHRGLATGVRFLTGHRMTKEESGKKLELNWQSLADPDTTLVIYMGLANLNTISQKLIEHGLSESTPAAAIEQGTSSAQKIVQTTLGKLYTDVQNAQLHPPTLIIIGKVAALHEELQWLNTNVTAASEEAPPPFSKL